MDRTDLIRRLHHAKLLKPYAEAAADRPERQRQSKLDRQRRWIAKQRAKGLCKSCSEPAVAGGRCEYHRTVTNRATKERMRDARASV